MIVFTSACAMISAIILGAMIHTGSRDVGKMRTIASAGVLALIASILLPLSFEYIDETAYALSSITLALMIADQVGRDGRLKPLVLMPIASAIVPVVIAITSDDLWIVYSSIACAPLVVCLLMDTVGIAGSTYVNRRGILIRMITVISAMSILSVPAFHDPSPMVAVAGFTAISLIMYVESEMKRFTMEPRRLLLNRYALENILEREYSKYRDDPELKMCIAFGDMDSFGRIRREQGREASEECMLDVATALSRLGTKRFIPCLYSGDEFAFIIFGDMPFAEECVRRCYSAIAEVDEKHPFMIHMSIGIAEVTNQDDHHDVIFQADRKLAEVKEMFYRENGLERHAWGRG